MHIVKKIIVTVTVTTFGLFVHYFKLSGGCYKGLFPVRFRLLQKVVYSTRHAVTNIVHNYYNLGCLPSINTLFKQIALVTVILVLLTRKVVHVTEIIRLSAKYNKTKFTLFRYFTANKEYTLSANHSNKVSTLQHVPHNQFHKTDLIAQL